MTDGNWMIIEVGGKQHLVTAGARITANRSPLEVGATFDAVNILDGSKVQLSVFAHTFGPKINGLKFKNKVRYLKRYGHRQGQTVFEVAPAKKSEPKADKLAPAKKKPAAKTAKAAK
jgi:ribosomal protein L21